MQRTKKIQQKLLPVVAAELTTFGFGLINQEKKKLYADALSKLGFFVLYTVQNTQDDMIYRLMVSASQAARTEV
ncbi:hypothetical protein Y1Q_0000512 [Alligator mississippiensis]|uniref:Uncharacterized protein n=1 Tax=Alligator mississippiensis TaxID=8496 RepID=A0A151MBC2_ALLMI|nr:hypothetical protein Y1Q_0000512 [Alligator mississippiensis]